MIDLHCDTASRLYYEGGKLKENKFSVDIKKLKTGKVSGQVFAHFIELDKCKNPYEEFLSMHNNFLKEINDNKDLVKYIFDNKFELIKEEQTYLEELKRYRGE